MSGVTIITPTGGRPVAFGLCQRWMARQQGLPPDVQWIVVDDVDPASEVMPIPGWQIDLVRPEPRWEMGQITLARNMLAALPLIKHDRLVIIEDDDWFAPTWIATQLDRLENGCAIAAEMDTRYYNVRDRCYVDCQQKGHGSLFQTAMRVEMTETLRQVCAAGSPWIDTNLWRNVSFHNARLLPSSGLSIGIKGLPGRCGIGSGHGKFMGAFDASFSVARRWLGADADVYAEFFHP